MRLRLTAALLVALTVAAAAEPVAMSVTGAVVTRDPGGFAGLQMTLSEDSARAFAALTTANVGRNVELRIDGKTVLSALLRDPIVGGRLQVSGDYSRAELSAIAARVASGTARVEAEVLPR